jgi:spore germination cell wall hydrolase CwlJ-like protein
MAAAAIVAGIVMFISSVTTERPAASDAAPERPAAVVTTPAESAQTTDQTEPTVRFYLGASERDTVERVVMAEAGGESFEGQMLVAQCILNAAEKEGVQPSEAVVIYSYTSNRPDPTQSVKDAVAAVFDRGEVAIDAPVMYFYNPALVTSDWHESQIFIAEVGGHRFFAERSNNA